MARLRHNFGDSSAIEKQGKVLLLSLEDGEGFGLEDTVVDPDFVLTLAERGPFTGIILDKEVAVAHYKVTEHTLPLVVRLNRLKKGVPSVTQTLTCTVEEALVLGARAVCYALCLSVDESTAMIEFSHIVRDAGCS